MLGPPLEKGGYKLPRPKLGNSTLLLPMVPGTQGIGSTPSRLLWVGVLPGVLSRALYLLGPLPHESTPVGTCLLPTLCML